MNPWLFLFLWVSSQALQLTFGVLALCQRPEIGRQRRVGALVVSGYASVVPLVTLLLFLWVFVIGGSSNVAQHARFSGLDLWSLWFQAWPFLLFGNPLSCLVAVVAALLPPYPPRHWKSFASRVCAIVAAGFACYVVVTFFPDA